MTLYLHNANVRFQHTVRSGESLANLASRYSISLSQLKSYNDLHSNTLRIGQVLKIPADYELVVKNRSPSD